MRISPYLFVLIFMSGCHSTGISSRTSTDETVNYGLSAATEDMASDTTRSMADDILEFYPNITQLSPGPLVWDMEIGTGQYYRLLVTRVELDAILFVEFIVTDNEGIERRVKFRYHVPFKYFERALIRHESHQIQIVKWLAFNLVKIKVDEVCYQLSLSPNPTNLKVQLCR